MGMGKLFGLVMLVVGLWASLTLYTDGIEGVTGQLESFVLENEEDPGSRAHPAAAADRRSLPRRVGDVVEAKLKKGDDRRSRLLDNL